MTGTESSYETSLANLTKLAKDYEVLADRNEATTRLEIIDSLLFECLGWNKTDCISEDSYDGEYADYTLLAPRPRLIVEAKREGDYFDIPAGKKSIEYSIKTIIKGNQGLENAIRQVAKYCQERGVKYAMVCNGHQIVIFVAITEGSPPLDGKALVFPNFKVMQVRFLDLWNVASKAGIQERGIENRLLGRDPRPVLARLSDSISPYPGTKRRNSFQSQLQILSDLVLEDLTKEETLEKQFLMECYCESGALSEYSLLSRNIIQARYAALFNAEVPGPSVEPAVTKRGITADLLAKNLSKRPILLLGDVGVGKTTFLRHLIKVDAYEEFKKSIVIHLNLGESAVLSLDLREFVLDQIEDILLNSYDIDISDQKFIRGMYHGELSRFARGIYAPLKDSDPSAFLIKEIEFLELKLNNKANHIRDSLRVIENSYKRQVVIFIDNTDQRSYELQQEAFLIAQEMAAQWSATVFIPLRPETYYSSIKTGGALSGYHAKAFTISPPRIDKVIEKRVDFALKITRGEIPITTLENTTVQLSTLETIY